MKRLVWSIFESTIGLALRMGLGSVVRGRRQGSVPILMYHSVAPRTDGEPPSLNVVGMRITPACFRRQMEYVASRYQTISIAELIAWQAGELELPPNPIVVTFDDGYLDVYEHAVPVLEELKLKATFFIMGAPMATGEVPWLHRVYDIIDTAPLEKIVETLATTKPALPTGHVRSRRAVMAWVVSLLHHDTIDRPSRQALLDTLIKSCGDNLAATTNGFMSPEQVRDLDDRGFEIGCHSTFHEYMSRLSDAELDDDIQRCQDAVSRVIGRPADLFCYPFGHHAAWDQRVADALQRHGFVASCSTITGLNGRNTDPFGLLRIDVSSDISLSRFVFRGLGMKSVLKKAAGRLRPGR